MIPIYSAMLKWMGSVTASNKNLRDSLKVGSCAVVVDGIAGMYVNEPKKEMIKFSGRKGFVRAAVETGTPIIPVYQFGNSQILKLVPKALEPFARKIKCAIGLIVGRFGLPIPHKVMVMSVLGKPISVPKVDKNDPSFDKVVDEVQQQVCDEIQRVYVSFLLDFLIFRYYKYRSIYGWGDRPLEIY